MHLLPARLARSRLLHRRRSSHVGGAAAPLPERPEGEVSRLLAEAGRVAGPSWMQGSRLWFPSSTISYALRTVGAGAAACHRSMVKTRGLQLRAPGGVGQSIGVSWITGNRREVSPS